MLYNFAHIGNEYAQAEVRRVRKEGGDVQSVMDVNPQSVSVICNVAVQTSFGPEIPSRS